MLMCKNVEALKKSKILVKSFGFIVHINYLDKLWLMG